MPFLTPLISGAVEMLQQLVKPQSASAKREIYSSELSEGILNLHFLQFFRSNKQRFRLYH
jgi:hypothetical protein